MEKVCGVLVITMLRMLLFFGFDNSSSSHADNRKNNFLVLGEGHTFGNNGSFGKKRQEKSLV